MFYEKDNNALSIFTKDVFDRTIFMDLIQTTGGAYRFNQDTGLDMLRRLSGFTICVEPRVREAVKDAIKVIDDSGVTSVFVMENKSVDIVLAKQRDAVVYLKLCLGMYTIRKEETYNGGYTILTARAYRNVVLGLKYVMKELKKKGKVAVLGEGFEYMAKILTHDDVSGYVIHPAILVNEDVRKLGSIAYWANN
eukprot:GHVS01098804.1.p1 GENE.GHVS01098804.1~~GHVS01098804.1.p1  ORF type:complete len:194 (+),score=6.70 GHVS01098804.1:386-967(+)